MEGIMRNRLILLIMAFAMIVCPANSATHDYVIENQPGAAFRSDLNNVLSAIVTNNSSASEPTTMYANMWWYDTSTSLLKRRNNANNAWIVMGLEAADTDGTLAANSDSKVPTQKATKTYADTKIAATYLDTDTTLAANSDVKIATQKATKAYVLSKATDAAISVTDVTTNNASTSAHGFLKKLSNVATEFMNGAGNWVSVTIDGLLPAMSVSTSGKFLTNNGNASSWGSMGQIYAIPVTNVLIISSDSQSSQFGNAQTWGASGKKITIGTNGATFTVQFEQVGGDQTRIYLNGSATGTLFTGAGVHSQTLTLAPSDYIEIWGKDAPGGALYVKNFRIYLPSSLSALSGITVTTGGTTQADNAVWY